MAPVINVKNLYNNVFNQKVIKNLLPVNPTARQAANLALWSTLTKDALGCAMYTTQSYNNKEIPDDKRTFVTALDLSNGICNVVIPMITGPILSKHSDKLFNKWFGKNFDDSACEKMYNTLTKAGKTVSKENLSNVIKKQSRSWGEAGFGVITMLVYSQILVKRIITPTLSTTLADYVKLYIEKFDERKEAKKAQISNINKQNATKDEPTSKELEGNANPFKGKSVFVISPAFNKFNEVILKEQ